jgi:hypothetical protein
LQRGGDRRSEIGRGLGAVDAAGRTAARGALQCLVLIEDRTAHLQQPALVNRAHNLIRPHRGIAPHAKNNAKRVPKIFIVGKHIDDVRPRGELTPSGVFLTRPA